MWVIASAGLRVQVAAALGRRGLSGTTSLDSNTFSLVVRDVIRGLGHNGVRRPVVLNGHFENAWPAAEGLDFGLRELRRGGIGDMQALRLGYWAFVRREAVNRLFPRASPAPSWSTPACSRPRSSSTSAPTSSTWRSYPTTARPVSRPTTAGPCRRASARARACSRTRGTTAKKGALLMADRVTLIAEAVRPEFGLAGAGE